MELWLVGNHTSKWFLFLLMTFYVLSCVFKVYILCIYRRLEMASYLQVKSHLETLAWMKFNSSGHNWAVLTLKSVKRMTVVGA